MAKATVEVYVHSALDHNKKPTFSAYGYDASNYGEAFVTKFTAEFDLPLDFNPIKAECEVVRKQLQELEAKTSERRQQLQDKLANLLALEYTP